MKVRIFPVGPAPEACLAVRHEVFVVEQKVPLELEVDGEDHECLHALATLDGGPIGAARMRLTEGYGKIQRVCTLKQARGTGAGVAIMQALLDELCARGKAEARLSAQVDALAFYEKLGFVPKGDTYMDAGIPHRDMVLDLRTCS